MYIKHVLNLTNSSYSPTCPLPSNSAPSHDQSNKHHSSAQPSECLPASPTHPANLPSPNRHKRPSPRTSSRLSPTRYANATPPLKNKTKTNTNHHHHHRSTPPPPAPARAPKRRTPSTTATTRLCPRRSRRFCPSQWSAPSPTPSTTLATRNRRIRSVAH